MQQSFDYGNWASALGNAYILRVVMQILFVKMPKVNVNKNLMFMYEKRLETFKNWPFDTLKDANCTAQRLAHSGFFRPNPEEEPDNTRCFMCYKELEGWEVTDDPDTEHLNHSSNCSFLSLIERNAVKMTMQRFIELQYKRQIHAVMLEVEYWTTKLQEEIDSLEN